MKNELRKGIQIVFELNLEPLLMFVWFTLELFYFLSSKPWSACELIACLAMKKIA